MGFGLNKIGSQTKAAKRGKGLSKAFWRTPKRHPTGSEDTLASQVSSDAIARILAQADQKRKEPDPGLGIQLQGALEVIELALLGSDRIRNILQEMAALLAPVQAGEPIGQWPAISTQLNKMAERINAIVEQCGHDGVNLVDSNGGSLEIALSDRSDATHVVDHQDLSASSGLGLPSFSGEVSAEQADQFIALTSQGVDRIDRMCAQLCASAKILSRYLQECYPSRTS